MFTTSDVMFMISDNRVIILTYLGVNKYSQKHNLDTSLPTKIGTSGILSIVHVEEPL